MRTSKGAPFAEWAFVKGHTEWLTLLAAASLVLGWASGSWRAALLALMLVPLGAAFGYPDSRFHEPFPMYIYAAIVTPFSAGFILIGVGARKTRDRRARLS
jgi:hypothetical protein